MWTSLVPLCLALVIPYTRSVPIPLGLESVQKYLLPKDPRAPVILKVLEKLSTMASPRLVVSTGDPTYDIDRVLQFYISKLDKQEGMMVTGNMDGKSGVRFQRIEYCGGDVFGRVTGNIDLLFISSKPNIKGENDEQMAKKMLEAIKMMKNRGLILLDGCGATGEGCKMLEHFTQAAKWKKSFDTLGSSLSVWENTVLVPVSPRPAKDTQQTGPGDADDAINAMLREGNLQALFTNVISPSDKRYPSMMKAASLAKERGARVIVEAGAMKSGGVQCGADGCSTIIFARLAKMLGGRLHTVDKSERNIDLCRASTTKLRLFIEYHKKDPIDYISNLQGHIDLLYLDSLDFDGQDQGPAQLQQLGEVKAAENKLHPKSVIILDDCQLQYEGKCKLSTQFLLSTKWKVIYDGYQRVFIKMADDEIAARIIQSRPNVVIVRQEPVVQAAPPPPPKPVGHVMKELKEGNIDAIFSGLIDEHSGRYVSFRRVADLAMQRGAKVMVETGTARGGVHNCGGDGCSTAILGRLAVLLGAHLHTVDISQPNIEASRRGTADLSSHIDYHVSDSVQFLKLFGQKIDVLYLDSYDYDGIEYGPSQQHHLNELLAAVDKLHDNTIIFIDDCSLSYEGKCKMASQYLSSHGWKLEVDKYQRVYTKIR